MLHFLHVRIYIYDYYIATFNIGMTTMLAFAEFEYICRID